MGELRDLKETIQQQATAAEAFSGTSAGEPCSEPSMQSSRAGSGSGDEEAPSVAPRSIIQHVATPQHSGIHQSAVSDRGAAVQSSCWSTRWNCSSSEHALHHEPLKVVRDEKRVHSKAEKVLKHLLHSLDLEGEEAELSLNFVDAQPFETVEMHLGQLWRLVRQAKLDEKYHRQSVDLALKALRCHGSSLKIRRDVTRLLTEIGNKDVVLKERMIAKGAIKLTIDTLHFLISLFPASGSVKPEATATSPAADVCYDSFRLLGTLSPQGMSDSLALATLDAVLKCLEKPPLRNTNSAIHGCFLIMSLVDKRFECKDLVRRNKGIELLLDLLDIELREVAIHEGEVPRRSLDQTHVIEQGSALLCKYIAGCLAQVAKDNESNQQALYKIGGIDLLLRTLKTCLQSGQVVHNVCVAIAYVTKDHEPSQHAARSQGAVGLILDALLAYRGESSVQGGVFRAIAALTERNAFNQQAFLAERLPDGDSEIGILALLLEGLKGNKEEPLVTTICWALANLTVGSPTAMDQVRCLGGLNIVVSLLSWFAQEERACEYLCRFFTELVRGDSAAASRNREYLRALRAKETITAMAQHHVQSEGFVLVRVQDALQNLGR